MFKRYLVLFGVVLVGCVVFQTSIFAEGEKILKYPVSIENGDSNTAAVYSTVYCVLKVNHPLSVDFGGKAFPPEPSCSRAQSDNFGPGATVTFNVTSAKDAEHLDDALNELMVVCFGTSNKSVSVAAFVKGIKWNPNKTLVWCTNAGTADDPPTIK